MAYQSIGQLNTTVEPAFKYVAPAPVVPKFNINSVSKVPDLNAALHAGQINQNQWMQRFKQIQATTNGPKIQPYSPKSILGSAVGAANKVLVQPVEQGFTQSANELAATPLNVVGPKPQDQVEQIAQQAQQRALKGGATKQQASDIADKVRSKGLGQVLGSAGIGLNTSKAGIGLKAAANIGGTAATLAGVPETKAAGLLGKAAETAKAAVGKDATVSDLINNTRSQNLTEALNKAKQSVPVPRSALDNHIAPVEAETAVTGPAKVSGVKSDTTTPTPATTPNPTNESKVSGSSLRTQAKAVEAGMKSEENLGATYNTVSHKDEAAKAVQLLQNDPEKAKAIALGGRGDNASHEAAVYHAVANQTLEEAKKTGDYSQVQQLANSPRHTTVSEAAQKLGAEGFNANPHDPINIMNDLAKTRQKAVAGRTGATLEKETANISKQVKSSLPDVSRQDWHSFVQDLRC